MQSYEYDVKPKRSHGKRYTYFGGLLLLLVIAALVVSIVALVRQQNSEKDNDSLRSPTPKPQPTTTIDDHKSSPGSPSPETKPTTTTDNTVDSRSDSVVECGVNGAVRSPITRNACVNTDGCVWQSRSRTEKTPACIYKDKVGYVLDGDVTIGANTWTARLKKTGIDTVYGMDVYNNINVQVEMINENALRIYMYPDKSMKAWEIPGDALTMDIPRKTSSHKLYNVSFTTEPVFGVVVERITNSTVKTKIIDTAVTGTIFSRQFMQLTTRLSSGHVYGFGEHNHRRFKHDMDWKTWPIFTRDVAPVDEWNLYGAHPVYLNLEEDGKANMVFLKNSHAMDVVLQPEPFPAITWKVIGGVLDFYVFLGPSPHEAVQQYISAIGKPLMPSYWSLGFHLCKWGYENLTVVQDVVKRNKMAEIPQDVQWGDIDYMFNKFDFTVDKKTFKDLPEFVDELHQNGQRYVIIVDVGIGANETIIEQGRVNSPGYEMYKDGIDMDVFVKNHDGTVLKGEVWPGLTVFPDFSHTNATDFWIKYIKYFNDTEGVKLDGLWIDMNEPASFVQGSINGCNNNTLNYPPYVPHILDGHTGSLYYKTICMDSKQKWGNHYEVHSLYGHAESMVTYRAMTTLFNKTRPFIMTRSSFAGTGKYSFKWLGDNQSQWRQIPWSIIGILEFSMFGFPMIGADICGFWYAAQYEMCLRWSQLGAFYPFARNHNAKGWPHQDPAHWDEAFISIARRALHIRYKILPYLYTLFHLAHTTSSMVARPLVFEFPEDKQTRDVDRQFLLGSAFLVTPVLEKGKSSVEGYFPKQRWFNYYDGTELAVTGQRITVDAPLPIIPLHLRGGYILPTQQPANTTVYSRQRPMGLIVAFNEETSARGDLFWDDGESIDSVTRGEYLKVEISATKGKYLEYKVVENGYKAASLLVIDTIELYGLFGFPERIIVDSVQIPTSSVRSKEKIIEIMGLNLNITENHSLSWEFF